MSDMSPVPQKFQFLLPSSRVQSLDVKRDKVYIIENLLKRATLDAWRWLFQSYSTQDLIEVVKNSINLSKRDVMLWSLMFDIPQKEIKCLQTKSRAGLNSSWQH